MAMCLMVINLRDEVTENLIEKQFLLSQQKILPGGRIFMTG
jgi:hypothetical protein